MNYIETSFLRSSSFEYLQTIPNKKISFKLFYELLSGMTDENQFIKRKIQILKAKKLDAYIDWRTPNAIIFNAFGIDAKRNCDSDAIKSIVSYISDNTTYADLNENILESEFGISLDRIREHDLQGVNIIKNQVHSFIDNERKINSGFNKFFSKGENNFEIYSAVELDKDLFIKELVNQIVKSTNNPIITYSKLLNNYDGTLDLYLRCMGMHNNNVILTGKYLGKNDGHDYDHLLYIANDDIVYSNDHIFKSFEEYGYLKLGNNENHLEVQ